MEKKPFLTEEQAQQILQDVPTPFHVYDEKGIRENVRRINKAFSWNKGFKGGGLRRGLLFLDRADAQRGLRLYGGGYHVLL